MMILGRYRVSPLFAAITAGALWRFILIWTGLCEGTLIADDAYYYFAIARNIATGNGPTFDTLSATNGFHPLWMLILVPIFAAFGGQLWFPVRMALSVSAVFDILSGVLIYRILKSGGYSRAAAIALGIWLFSPFTMYLGLRGMEASLSVLLMLLLISESEKSLGSAGAFDRKAAFGLGVIFGLSCLARTDNAVFLGIPLVAAVLFSPGAGDNFRYRIRNLAIIFIVAAIAVAPWLAWNYANFGMVTQVSAAVKMHLGSAHGPFAGWGDLPDIVRSGAYRFFAPITFPSKFLAGEEFISPAVSVIMIGGVFLLMLAPAVDWVVRAFCRSKRRLSPVIIYALAYAIVHILAFGLFFDTYATWYAYPFWALLAILLGLALDRIWGTAGNPRVFATALLAVFVTFQVAAHVVFMTRADHVPRGPERTLGPVLTRLAADYPGGVTAGALNAGAYGYIASAYGPIKVVNLDCLVNNRAYEAFRRGQYCDYVISTVDVLLEDPARASYLMGPADAGRLEQAFRFSTSDSYWRRQTAVAGP